MNLNNNLSTTSSNNIQSNINTGNSQNIKPVFPPIKRQTTEQPLAQNTHKNFVDSPTHFETDYISMKWIPEKRRIDVIWKQFVSEEKVREVLLKEVAMIRHTKVKCLFLDAQKFKGTNPNIPRWANEVWSQMVHDAGLKHFATVVSDKDIFAVFSLKYGMGEKLTSLVNCAVFKTVEEGEVWLRQYTHPENPVYSEEELEEVMEEHESLSSEIVKNNEVEINQPIELDAKNEDEEEISIGKEQVLESEIVGTVLDPDLEPVLETILETTSEINVENELENFDLRNEKIKDDSVENESEEEETKDNENSQIQVFSNFEDLENHIQGIEANYEMKESYLEDTDNSGNQS